MKNEREHKYVSELRRSFAEGRLGRREFLRSATLLGLSATAAYAFAEKVTGQSLVRSARASIPKGGDLRIGMRVQEITDPATFAWTEVSNIARQVCEYLSITGHDNITRPYLLESWEVSEDLRTWTLNLRKQIKWRNGRQFTADDVVWNLYHVLDPAVGSSILGLMTGYMMNDAGDALWDAAAIEKVDDYTVRLNLKKPHIAVPEDLFHYTLLIVDPEDGGKFGPGSNGTGAFELLEHEVGRTSTLEARSNYWGEGPYLDTLRFIDLGNDPSAQIAALASKQVHGIYESDITQLPALKGLDHLEIYEAETAWTSVARVKVNQRPFDDPRVRVALRKAIDREKVLAVACQNIGSVGEHHHVHPTHPEYSALPPIKQDIEGARRLLVEAGYPDGLDLEITCKNDPPWEAIAVQAMVEMWKLADIRVKINLLPSSAYWDVWDKAPFGFTQWGHRPLGIQVLGLAYRTGGPWNESEYANPTFDKLLSEAEGTLDPVERSKVMREIEILMQEDGPIVQPLWRSIITAFDKQVAGFQMHPSNFLFANQLGIASV